LIELVAKEKVTSFLVSRIPCLTYFAQEAWDASFLLYEKLTLTIEAATSHRRLGFCDTRDALQNYDVHD
jgi:hypothetical protein